MTKKEFFDAPSKPKPNEHCLLPFPEDINGACTEQLNPNPLPTGEPRLAPRKKQGNGTKESGTDNVVLVLVPAVDKKCPISGNHALVNQEPFETIIWNCCIWVELLRGVLRVFFLIYKEGSHPQQQYVVGNSPLLSDLAEFELCKLKTHSKCAQFMGNHWCSSR